MSDKQGLELSLVIPVFNEEGCIETLCGEITAALDGKYDYEAIFVDDGSADSSFSILSGLAEKNNRFKVVKFRKNFGQTAALSAGFKFATGEIIVPLDADCQNDPADIPRLVEKLKEGYDIVSGWRRKRHDNTVTRTLPSRIANWLIARITGVKLHDFGCTLKAYRKSSLAEIRLYGEMHRFIPALASWGGENVVEMVVNHRPRTTGVAKYGLSRTYKVVLDLITIKFLASYSTKPIYVFGGLGVIGGFGAVLSGLAVLYQKYISSSHLSMNRNPLLVMTAMLFMASIQFVLMGLLAEILVRTYHESQDRATYTIDRVVNGDATENS